MRRLALVLTLTLAIPALLSPALARPLDGTEAASLQRTVDGFLGAIERKNVSVIVATIPPRIKSQLAGMMGIEAAKLEETLTDQTRTVMQTAEFSDLSVSLEGVEASDATLEDGTEVIWALLPTQFTMEMSGSKTRLSQSLLALREGNDWYLMRIEGDQQKQMVGLAYPFMKDMTIPAGTVTPLN